MSNYAYFWGCFIQERLPHLEKSVRAVLDHLGLSPIDLPGLTCCPEKGLVQAADHQTWLNTAARNLSIAEAAGCRFVTPCTGCFASLHTAETTLKLLPEAAGSANRALASIGRSYSGGSGAVHLLEVLHQEFGAAEIRRRVVYPMTGLRVSVHYGCHLLKPSGELGFDDARAPHRFDELVEALGAESIDHETKFDCCGNLLLRAGDDVTSQAMARLKLRDALAAGADALVVVCPSCTLQFDNTQLQLQRKGESLGLPVLYYSELLGLALGLSPEELGLSSHRVDVAPFLERWRERRAGLEQTADHFPASLVQACAACRACAPDCPVAQADLTFDPTAIVDQLARGEVERVLGEGRFWRCMECHTCTELCVQSYSMADIFRGLKRLGAARGQVPAVAAEEMAAFRKRGRLAEGSAIQRKRLDLPPLLPGGADELRALLGGAESEDN